MGSGVTTPSNYGILPAGSAPAKRLLPSGVFAGRKSAPTAHPSLVSRYHASAGIQERSGTTLTPVADNNLVGSLADLGTGKWPLTAPSDGARPTMRRGTNCPLNVDAILGATGLSLDSAASYWNQYSATGCTVLALVKPGATGAYRVAVGGSNTNLYVALDSSAAKVYCRNGSATTGASVASGSINVATFGQNAVVIGAKIGTNSISALVNGNVVATSSGVAANLTGTLKLLNGGTGNLFYDSYLVEVRIYSGTLSAADIKSETADMMAQLLDQPQIWLDSNSLGTGNQGNLAHSLKAVLMAELGPYINIYDTCINGHTTESKASLGVTSKYLAHFGSGSANRPTIYTIWEGTNDLAAGKTPAQAWANIESLLAEGQASGIRNMIVGTVAARSAAAFADADRLTLNASIRAGAGAYGATVWDVCSIVPALDLTASLTDTTIYAADQIHFSNQTYVTLGKSLAAVIRGAIPVVQL